MAKKIISDIEKGVGFIGGFIPTLMNAMRSIDAPFEAAYRLVTEDGAATVVKIARVIKDDWLASQPKPALTVVAEPEPAITECDLTVDYGKTVEAMLKAGEYNGYVNPNVTTRNYPVAGAGVVQRKAQLVHFGKNMSDAAVDAWCEEHGKRRATALEVLTFGAAYKLLQLEYPIVSGQAAQVGGDRDVVYLGGGDRGRGVYLGWTDDDWDDHCRFLVFDKERT